MTDQKERFKFLVFFLVACIGFFAGINYFENSDIKIVQIAKGCFEFGLLQLLENKNLFILLCNIVVSSTKYCVLMVLGSLSWWLFALIPANAFSLGFKQGIVVSFVIRLLGIRYFFDCLLICLFSSGILVFFSFICLKIFNKRLYSVKFSKTNNTDREFLLNMILMYVFLIIGVFLFFVFLKIVPSRLCGLTQTFL